MTEKNIPFCFIIQLLVTLKEQCSWTLWSDFIIFMNFSFHGSHNDRKKQTNKQ